MSSRHSKSDDDFYRQTLSKLNDGKLCASALSSRDVHRFMKTARAKEERDRDRIHDNVQAGVMRKAQLAQRAYIAGMPARLVAASKKTWVRTGNPSERFASIYYRARLAGFDAQSGEIRPYKKRKAGGGTRTICEFRGEDQVQQCLLANSILPFFGDHPGQFGQRGRDLAVETLRHHVEQGRPDDVFLHGDISQFYDNV